MIKELIPSVGLRVNFLEKFNEAKRGTLLDVSHVSYTFVIKCLYRLTSNFRVSILKLASMLLIVMEI